MLGVEQVVHWFCMFFLSSSLSPPPPPSLSLSLFSHTHTHSLSLSPYSMTFKMYAVDFCELLLFDERKQAYHLVLHCFEKKNVLDAYIR